jgi:hypothetical protein
MDITEKSIPRGEEWERVVTDKITGRHWLVAGAACSAPGCFCDAIIVAERGAPMAERVAG